MKKKKKEWEGREVEGHYVVQYKESKMSMYRMTGIRKTTISGNR